MLELLGIIAIALFITNLILWRLVMDVATLLSKLSDLSTAVDALVAKASTPPADLQPVADAIDAISAKVKAVTG